MYKRQDGDVVLARFSIHGNSPNSGDVRFIKRRGKFYRINDIDTYIWSKKPPTMLIEHKKDESILEITFDKIIELIEAAFKATMNWDGEGETYEIWINHYIMKDLSRS